MATTEGTIIEKEEMVTIEKKEMETLEETVKTETVSDWLMEFDRAGSSFTKILKGALGDERWEKFKEEIRKEWLGELPEKEEKVSQNDRDSVPPKG